MFVVFNLSDGRVIFDTVVILFQIGLGIFQENVLEAAIESRARNDSAQW